MDRNSKLDLVTDEQRLAYKLLAPTLIILLIVAIYPLSQVFYTSFTDRTFAGTNQTHFIGLNNYSKLLNFTIKELPPVIEQGTNQVKIDSKTGEKVYEPSFKVLPGSPKPYKELSQFNFLGKRYVVGATNPEFINSIITTLIFTLSAVSLETVLGLIIALLVNSNFTGRGLMRAVMLLPWAVITVVSARIWEWILAPSRVGLFNMFLEKIGIGNGQLAFLTADNWQLFSLIMVDVWKTTPFMALLILAGLQLIPGELYEAARVDGANKVRQFFSITFPLLKPALAVALIFRTLDSLRVFGLFQVLVGQRLYSLASYNYYQLVGNRAMGLASAVGVIIFMIIFVFAVIYMRLLGVDSE
ncbi:ABC transporter permease subunit [Iocasia frigidifontis]|uniref:ABC transporter permease subunit n=1 Tax=Iocasia fonsfrigidae TaxID=2682810 RepID=A0A8A7KBQ2_9FIRM|nr:sugar ABC transporter permease [Iocasia fonsfrigidae]QTL96779.1 ABC transporter permease subunit [Iocasia fonsfrigidae]